MTTSTAQAVATASKPIPAPPPTDEADEKLHIMIEREEGGYKLTCNIYQADCASVEGGYMLSLQGEEKPRFYQIFHGAIAAFKRAYRKQPGCADAVFASIKKPKG